MGLVELNDWSLVIKIENYCLNKVLGIWVRFIGIVFELVILKN